VSLDKAIADAVRAALAEQLRAPSPQDWIPHHEWPFPKKRAAYLARTGAIKARLDKRTWYAPRADVDAYAPRPASTLPATALPTEWPEVAGVYFLRAAGLVKIGRTSNVRVRLRKLQKTSPVELQLLLVLRRGSDDAKTLEAELHRRFAEHRRHGEWFEPHPNLLNFIHSQGDGDG